MEGCEWNVMECEISEGWPLGHALNRHETSNTILASVSVSLSNHCNLYIKQFECMILHIITTYLPINYKIISVLQSLYVPSKQLCTYM